MIEHLYLEDGSVNPKLIKLPIIIWGCGKDGFKLYHKLKEYDAEITAFCDSNSGLYGERIFDLPIISCEEALGKGRINLALAFHQWINIINNIKDKIKCEIFADYLYEKPVKDAECILCGSSECMGSKAHFAPFLIERMFEGISMKTRLIHCRKCDFWFSQYRPNDLEMGKLYNGYRNEDYERQRKQYEPDYSIQPYFLHEAIEKRRKDLASFLNQYIKCDAIHVVLDYGGDEGQFIPEQFENADKYVYEISGNKVRSGVTLLTDLVEVRQKKFDFIMCCHVLEHVSNPMEIIENMTGVLAKNGFLYIEVPNQNYFKAYSDIEINEHVNFFFQDTMKYIARKKNLRIVNESNMETEILCKSLFVNSN